MKIIQAKTESELDHVRMLYREYAGWMDYEYCFDTFEEELANLPDDCVPPDGALLLALVDNEPAGCVALHKIKESVCEFKRLWVRENFRGQKIGVKLTNEIIQMAKNIGYLKMTLETTPKMKHAISIYESIGFKQTATVKDGRIINMEMDL